MYYISLLPPLQQIFGSQLVISDPFLLRVAARIPTGFGMRKFKRKNVLMSNDFICVVKDKRKQ